jgi:hypothetical protein
MIVHSLQGITPDDFADRTGWAARPEGLCRGEVCVPAPGLFDDDGTLDLQIAGHRLGMPLVEDVEHGVWALGPATATGRALSTAVAADVTLPDRDGNPFRLASLHGRKVLLVAWASY